MKKKVIIPEITQVYLYEIKNSLRHETVSSYKGHAILRLFGIDQSDAEFIIEAGNHPFGTYNLWHSTRNHKLEEIQTGFYSRLN